MGWEGSTCSSCLHPPCTISNSIQLATDVALAICWLYFRGPWLNQHVLCMFVAKNCITESFGSTEFWLWCEIVSAKDVQAGPTCPVHDLLGGQPRQGRCCGCCWSGWMSGECWLQPCPLYGFLYPSGDGWGGNQPVWRNSCIAALSFLNFAVAFSYTQRQATGHKSSSLKKAITTGCKDFSLPGLVCFASPLQGSMTPSGI